MYDSIIILGPTATGKTSLSIELAKLLNTEIINADSMYIYRDLNIGTAKPTHDEMKNIKHHLIGFLSTDESYSVGDYRGDAENIINSFREKNQTPIIVGGTGFYIDSLINNYSYSDNKDEEIRKQLEQELQDYGKELLYEKLKDLDFETYQKLHVNDTYRVMRACEIALMGAKKSDIINSSNPILSNPLIIGLNMARDILYDRINRRVEIMVNNGLLDEVQSLYNEGFNPTNSQAMKGIGYKELVDYFEGKCTLDEAIEKIKQHSRNYAKRQITWFKRNQNIIWLNPLEHDNLAHIILDIFHKKS